MPWLIFIGSSVLLVFAATKLAQYGDAIAARTGLGRLFVGTLLLAGATSLPELLTTINSFGQGVPDLAAGNLLGSNMFNMLLLAVLDLLGRQARILRRVAMKHALTASLASLLTAMVAFFILADIDIAIGHVGVDSLLLIAVYLVGVRLIRSGSPGANNVESSRSAEESAELTGVPRLGVALLGFGGATLILVLVSPWLVSSSKQIAELTGLGTGFVGTALVAVVTSLPEVATSVVAVRLGAYDLAIGNLFGSNAFNMMALGVSDFFYLPGPFLGIVAPGFVLVALLGLMLTGLGLIGNLARVERRLLLVEADALTIMILYGAGLAFLYMRGIGP
jgi:cation:H+ antiporter